LMGGAGSSRPGDMRRWCAAERHQNRVLSLPTVCLGDWHRPRTTLRKPPAAALSREQVWPQAKFTTGCTGSFTPQPGSAPQAKSGTSLRRHPSSEIENGAADDIVEKRELAAVVQRAIAALSERQRRVIILPRTKDSATRRFVKSPRSQSAVESFWCEPTRLRQRTESYQNSSL